MSRVSPIWNITWRLPGVTETASSQSEEIFSTWSSAEPAVWKGRRIGNLVFIASDTPLPATDLSRQAARAAFPYRFLTGREVTDWIGNAQPFSDADPQPSPAPKRNAWFS